MSSNTFFPLDFRGVNTLVFWVTFFDFLKVFSCWNKEETSDEPDFGWSIKTAFSYDVDCSVIGPDVSLVHFDHELEWFLSSLIAELGYVLWNELLELLIDLIVLVMFVHSSDIIDDVFIKDFSELFVFDVKLLQQKLDSGDRIEDVFRSEDHDGRNTFLADIWMEILAQFVH